MWVSNNNLVYAPIKLYKICNALVKYLKITTVIYKQGCNIRRGGYSNSEI